MAGDVIVIALSIYIAVAVRHSAEINPFATYTGASTWLMLNFLTVFYLSDLYNLDHKFKSTAFLLRFLLAVVIAGILVTSWSYLFPQWRTGRGVFLIVMISITILSFSWRLLFQYIFAAVITHKRRIAIVGAGNSGRAVNRLFYKQHIFEMDCFFDDNPRLWGKRIGGYEVVGGSDRMADIVRERGIDAIVVAIKNEKRLVLLEKLMLLKVKGIEIYDTPTLFEELTGKLPVNHLRQGWLVYAQFHGVRKSFFMTRFKRMMDVIISMAMLVVVFPVLLITAAAIKLSSKGPVIYRQNRVGLNGVVFEILKFRSMRVDAEASGAVWARENDDRVTPVGKIIRILRIDEIPQVWNVLKGEMSLIGPRPERPEMVAELEKNISFYGLRHSIAPGITGWAQVNYRYGASEEDALEKLQYDLFYMKNISIFLDFLIILYTIKVVLFGRGAR